MTWCSRECCRVCINHRTAALDINTISSLRLMEPVHKGLSQDPEGNDRDQGPLSQTWCREVPSVEIKEASRDGDQLDSSGSQTEG